MPSHLSASYQRRPVSPQARPGATTRRGILVLLAAPALDRAGQLDRRADAELAAGRVAQAEFLAHQAAAMRGQE